MYTRHVTSIPPFGLQLTGHVPRVHFKVLALLRGRGGLLRQCDVGPPGNRPSIPLNVLRRIYTGRHSADEKRAS